MTMFSLTPKYLNTASRSSFIWAALTILGSVFSGVYSAFASRAAIPPVLDTVRFSLTSRWRWASRSDSLSIPWSLGMLRRDADVLTACAISSLVVWIAESVALMGWLGDPSKSLL